jgi:uncharacterized membrane protein
MNFAAPSWFLLVPLLALAEWLWPRLGLRRPWRMATLGTAVLALADPRVQLGSGAMDVWVLCDRSASAEHSVAANLPEWERLLADRVRGDDRVFFVDYAAAPRLRPEIRAREFEGSRDETRTALAMEFALSRMDRRCMRRLLVLSDGYATEPLGGVAARLAAQSVPVDYRLGVAPSAVDFRVAEIAAPQRVQLRESFLAEARIAGTHDGEVRCVFFRDGVRMSEQTITVRGGVARARFADRLATPGAHRYEIEIEAAGDAHAGNNRREFWVEAAGAGRVLLATAYADDPVAAVLRGAGFEVELRTDCGALDMGATAGVRAVLLHNVPASAFRREFLDSLRFAVREQGVGLVMIGGRASFGTGGFFGGSMAELLPVSMELRKEERKLAVAMAVVMDRSGSMAAGVGGGLTKMDLANNGVARAIELLGTADAISVHAVDSTAHQVVPMSRVGNSPDRLLEVVRGIRSGGGGIYVYEGLKAGWAELQKAKTGVRHLILFSDAADSEEPGEYKELLGEMRKAGATVSVIGLGRDTDPDAALLSDIALRGGGRIFFTQDAAQLPVLFAQETVAVARSAFIEEPVATKGAPAWLEIAAQMPSWPGKIDGYNLSYLKPGASLGLVGTDAEAAPLVAFWQQGVGRSAAISFPLGGDFSASVRGWEGYGDFIQTLLRWVSASDAPPGVTVRPRMDGTRLQIDLFFDTAQYRQFDAGLPAPAVARGDGTVVHPAWQRLGPGHLSTALDLAPAEVVRGALQLDGRAVAFGPLTAGGGVEWDFDPARVRELRELSAATRGAERLKLESVWDAPREGRERRLRDWALLATLLLLLATVLRERWAGAR